MRMSQGRNHLWNSRRLDVGNRKVSNITRTEKKGLLVEFTKRET